MSERAADGNTYRYHATGLPAGGDKLVMTDRAFTPEDIAYLVELLERHADLEHRPLQRKLLMAQSEAVQPTGSKPDSLDIVSQLRDRRYPHQHEMREMAACVIEQLRRETLRLRPLTNEQLESLLLQGFPKWGFSEVQIMKALTFERMKDGIAVTRVRAEVLNLAQHLFARGIRDGAAKAEAALNRAEAALKGILTECNAVHFSRSRVQHLAQLGLGDDPSAPAVISAIEAPGDRMERVDASIATQLKNSMARNSRLCIALETFISAYGKQESGTEGLDKAHALAKEAIRS